MDVLSMGWLVTRAWKHCFSALDCLLSRIAWCCFPGCLPKDAFKQKCLAEDYHVRLLEQQLPCTELVTRVIGVAHCTCARMRIITLPDVSNEI